MRNQPATSTRNVYRYPADTGEVRLCVITGTKRELPHERTRHHDVARSDAAAELRELTRELHHGIKRVPEHRIAAADGDLTVLQHYPRDYLARRRIGPHRRAQNYRGGKHHPWTARSTSRWQNLIS
jgi:hypothetical protein